ncbi:hypothetical protein [Mesorhizobium sp. KR9-304]|uniref:hypothetical protein n=1 Tax=Mesorhizobium sp. KR9-304 TaxID=3156614 RepID=UPI0032B5DB3D
MKFDVGIVSKTKAATIGVSIPIEKNASARPFINVARNLIRSTEPAVKDAAATLFPLWLAAGLSRMRQSRGGRVSQHSRGGASAQPNEADKSLKMPVCMIFQYK